MARLLQEVKPNARPHTRIRTGALITTASWKHWPCLFPQHGLGRKHERLIVLHEWQRKVVLGYPDRFLRGLFHSDGCRATSWALDLVDVPWRQSNWRTISVSRRDAVARLDELIGLKR
ncbi:hypothetical protein [Nocardioides limicola]|uniref:hypothetical protein n=1 Tax=Nocardioides limicola TaxID=2803368 RepID=UPI001EEF8786|nr:hypothetical protein [Nocardioides sp. DJM-14]